MLGLNPLLSFIAVLLAGAIALVILRGRGAAANPTLSGAREHAASDPTGPLASRWAPIVVGALTGLATWFVWGSLDRSSVVHDETAYLLQAELFARFQWTAPAPPVAAFFEQLYLLVSPALASKYPPGTSLILVPGVWLGLPGLPIALMNAVTGGLVFATARRLSGGTVALLAWALWATSFPVLYFHAMYLSEVPSGLAWIATLWSLHRWHQTRRHRELALCAAALGLCAVTRPLTALALAIVVGGVLLRTIVRHQGSWQSRMRPLVPLATAAVLAVSTFALWSWRTTGDPFDSPLAVYTRTYVPFDGLGFGAHLRDAPSARLPWDQRVTSQAFFNEHQRHLPERLGAIAALRARMIARDMWHDWRGGLVVFALIGVVVASGAAWIGIGALVSQFALYLLYAHPPTWSLYYMEALPVLAFVTALGTARVWAWMTPRHDLRPRMAALATALLLIAFVLPVARTLGLVRAQIDADHRFYDSFVRLLPQRPEGAIVFVRYAPGHNDGLTLVRNVPDLQRAPVWTVYDRGAENTRLLALAPTRAAFLFDEATWTMRPLPRP